MRVFIDTLLKTQVSYRQSIQRKLKEKNIPMTFEMLQIIVSLLVEDNINQQDLGNKTFKDKACLSYILKNLEKKEMIIRIVDEQDKRNKLIHLTEKGKIFAKEVKELVNPIYDNVLKMVDKDNLDKCIKHLSEIEEAFKHN